jgi:hypothetical protein
LWLLGAFSNESARDVPGVVRQTLRLIRAPVKSVVQSACRAVVQSVVQTVVQTGLA